jgi:MFS family permease
MWRELTEGVCYIFGHQYWRAMTVATAIYNFFNYVAFAILVVYMVRHLHMSALAIGVTLSLSNCGALIAAFFAQRIGRRLGLGRAIVLATFFGFPLVLVPLAPGSYPIPFIILAFTLEGFGGVLFTVSTISLIHALTPQRLLGRANASRRFVVWGTIPLGGLLGGILASESGFARRCSSAPSVVRSRRSRSSCRPSDTSRRCQPNPKRRSRAQPDRHSTDGAGLRTCR